MAPSSGIPRVFVMRADNESTLFPLTRPIEVSTSSGVSRETCPLDPVGAGSEPATPSGVVPSPTPRPDRLSSSPPSGGPGSDRSLAHRHVRRHGTQDVPGRPGGALRARTRPFHVKHLRTFPFPPFTRVPSEERSFSLGRWSGNHLLVSYAVAPEQPKPDTQARRRDDTANDRSPLHCKVPLRPSFCRTSSRVPSPPARRSRRRTSGTDQRERIEGTELLLRGEDARPGRPPDPVAVLSWAPGTSEES